MTEYARDKIAQARIIAHERVNKSRITKIGLQADIVFIGLRCPVILDTQDYIQ